MEKRESDHSFRQHAARKQRKFDVWAGSPVRGKKVVSRAQALIRKGREERKRSDYLSQKRLKVRDQREFCGLEDVNDSTLH